VAKTNGLGFSSRSSFFDVAPLLFRVIRNSAVYPSGPLRSQPSGLAARALGARPRSPCRPCPVPWSVSGSQAEAQAEAPCTRAPTRRTKTKARGREKSAIPSGGRFRGVSAGANQTGWPETRAREPTPSAQFALCRGEGKPGWGIEPPGETGRSRLHQGSGQSVGRASPTLHAGPHDEPETSKAPAEPLDATGANQDSLAKGKAPARHVCHAGARKEE